MQLTQLFRQGVVRPLDERAARELATFGVDASIRVEWIPVSSDECEALWDSRVFERINAACGIEIDDYEEEVLPADRIENARQALRSVERHSASVSRFLDNLDGLLCDALAAHQDVYFIF